MKILTDRIKALLVNNRDTGGVLNYVPPKGIQKVETGVIPTTSKAKFPFIGIAPVSSPERWVSSGKREVTHTVEIYCVRDFRIVGQAVDKSMEFVEDVVSILRNERFSNYLDAPAQPSVQPYITTPYGDNIFLIVATIQLECRRLFLSTLP